MFGQVSNQTLIDNPILSKLPNLWNERLWNVRADQFLKMGKGSFNPEPTATVFFSGFATVAVGSGLNERKTDRPCLERSLLSRRLGVLHTIWRHKTHPSLGSVMHLWEGMPSTSFLDAEHIIQHGPLRPGSTPCSRQDMRRTCINLSGRFAARVDAEWWMHQSQRVHS
jgi:hypothetical protein